MVISALWIAVEGCTALSLKTLQNVPLQGASLLSPLALEGQEEGDNWHRLGPAQSPLQGRGVSHLELSLDVVLL